jgi:hypothetical protein
MSTYTQVGKWVDQLRGLPPGMSIATFFLVPPTGSPVVWVEQESAQKTIDPITIVSDRAFMPVGMSIATFFLVLPTGSPVVWVKQESAQKTIDPITIVSDRAFMPGGAFDIPIVHLSTPFRLAPPRLSMPMYPIEVKVESDNLPQILRDITGLPIETLASLANVSRNAYYKWLDGRGVSDEHISRLTELLDTFRTLHDLLGSSLREFLETPGPAGRPIDLLANGDSRAVIGLALRPLAKPEDSSGVSDVARRISGLPGWLHPPVKLSWGTPHLTDSERDDVLDQLSPTPLFSKVEWLSDMDEDDEAVVAWGFVLE